MQVTRGPLERLGFPLQKEKWGILELAVYSYVSFPFFHVHYTHELCVFLSPGVLFGETQGISP